MMKQFIEEAVKELKVQIANNIRQIDQKQIQIGDLIDQINIKEQKEDLDLLFSEIQTLMTENNKYIHMQSILVSYLEKIDGSEGKIDEARLFADLGYELPHEEGVIFDMTIQGELPFDHHHPMFTDKKFFDKLTGYYTSIEDYEKCNEVFTAKRQLYDITAMLAEDLLSKTWFAN